MHNDYEREHLTTLMDTEQRRHRLRVYGWAGALLGCMVFWAFVGYVIGRLM